jgi:hypothetical protein
VFGTETGGFQASFKTTWEALLLVANGHETNRIKPGAWVDRDRARLRQIDLHWHDLRGRSLGIANRRADLEVCRFVQEKWRARQDSNLWPTAPEAVALSS